MLTPERKSRFEQVARNRQKGLTVVIEDVFDPYNIGAITRTCDTFGIQQVHVIFETQPEFNPKEVGKNSSTATNKWIDYRIHHQTESALQSLKDEGWTLAATVIDEDAESIYEADLTDPKLAILFGNEKEGLTPRAIGMADRKVTIPMFGIAQSMNISVSAALFLYEITRQRRALDIDKYLNDEAGFQETMDYFIKMQEAYSKRAQRLRWEWSKHRKMNPPKSDD